MNYRPRNDVVLLRLLKRGVTESGIHLPQISEDDREWIVEGCGPDAKGLIRGDRVIVLLTQGSLVSIPGESDLFAVRQESILAIVGRGEEKNGAKALTKALVPQ